MENFTIYHKNGELKSLGWDINNPILKHSIPESLFIPAGLLYVNDNFKKNNIQSYDKGVVNNEIFDKLYSFVDGSKPKRNKTKKRRRKRKNKTRRY